MSLLFFFSKNPLRRNGRRRRRRYAAMDNSQKITHRTLVAKQKNKTKQNVCIDTNLCVHI